ncbi:MAG TPA: 4-alpha-glucanotransferase [Frankiaceae bacterium]|nr:4-alpha-glucanotransferase [Frankiaceae bacterium]
MDPSLQQLADAFGVAVEYEDWQRRRVEVSEQTVRRVLAGLGVDVDRPAEALRHAEEQRWRRMIPPTIVAVEGAGITVELRVPDIGEPVVELRLETGELHTLTAGGGASAGGARDAEIAEVGAGDDTADDEDDTETATHSDIVPDDAGVFERASEFEQEQRDGVDPHDDVVAGHHRRLRTLTLPADLPLGYHELRVVAGPDGAEESTSTLAVVPARVPLPLGLDRAWGWMVQLYAVRSAGSWGLGDYADLAELARWSGREQGAGLVLVNPLHAFAPVGPVQNSPYYPASRRFSSPLYLRPQLLPEYDAAPAEVRATVDRLANGFEAGGDVNTRIDRDAVWSAKREALEALYGHRVERPEAEQSQGLTDFATWCALAEEHGPDWHEWPDHLHDPHGASVAGERERLSERVTFHAWLQRCCDEQLADAQRSATDAGMPVGIVHDLAVGVDPGGADAWALQADLAVGFTVGAPPDALGPQGQDWRLPPWRPDRLAETGYAPFRDMVRAVLAKGGGLRVDHVLGLFRLWWVPEGASSGEGTYVAYDADAMLGILALEAARAGALVVGEDLGTVPDHVRTTLTEYGVFGSAVLWFEKDPDDEVPLPPEQWRELAMATVTTHDLPTVAGWWQAEPVRVRAELGLLSRGKDEELAAAAEERTALLRAAVDAGALTPSAAGEPDEETVALALHEMLVRSPSRVVLAALGDAIGDVRQPNLPGTTDEYPNWRLPVADGTGRPVPLEELEGDARVARLARLLDKGVA